MHACMYVCTEIDGENVKTANVSANSEAVEDPAAAYWSGREEDRMPFDDEDDFENGHDIFGKL